VAKGKRGKNSKAIKPTEDTIPEEGVSARPFCLHPFSSIPVEDEQKSEGEQSHKPILPYLHVLLEASGSSDLAIAGPATQPDNAPTIPDQVVSASNISVGLGSVVTDAVNLSPYSRVTCQLT
jgi:hypothetical protein